MVRRKQRMVSPAQVLGTKPGSLVDLMHPHDCSKTLEAKARQFRVEPWQSCRTCQLLQNQSRMLQLCRTLPMLQLQLSLVVELPVPESLWNFPKSRGTPNLQGVCKPADSILLRSSMKPPLKMAWRRRPTFGVGKPFCVVLRAQAIGKGHSTWEAEAGSFSCVVASAAENPEEHYGSPLRRIVSSAGS